MHAVMATPHHFFCRNTATNDRHERDDTNPHFGRKFQNISPPVTEIKASL